MENYSENIGLRCKKRPITKKPKKKSKSKPFKSGFKINTIKGVIEHPTLKIPAYTFEEDDSYVECRRCLVIEDEVNFTQQSLLNNFDEFFENVGIPFGITTKESIKIYTDWLILNK